MVAREVFMREREQFGTRLGFILVSAGCAVGLGNVWKFPYICGQNGGALFILIYLGFLFALGYPILVCEFSVGRGSACNPALAYGKLEASGSIWHSFRWLPIVGNYCLMMFYTMVGGWMLYYTYLSGARRLEQKTSDEIAGVFSDMLMQPKTMAFWTVLAIAISFAVCIIGLQNGIEKITKVMMSLLLILIVILAAHSLVLPNAMEGVKFYLVPSLDAIKERGWGTVIFDAMTHAFFTLSIGMGSMAIFGSYLNKERSIGGEARNVICLDTFVALMAGFIIIPACFAYGVEPGAGPSLLFITLPNIFNHMAGGNFWGMTFFVFMSFAALSTIIAVFETILSLYMDLFGWSRKKAVFVNFFLITVLAMPAVFGFSMLPEISFLGEGATFMDLEDFLVSYNLLPLGSLIYVLFCTRKNGWGWDNFIQEANTGSGMKYSEKFRGYMTYVLPVIIAVVYLKGYYDMFSSRPTPIFIGWMIFALGLMAFILYVAFYSRKENK